MMGLYARVSTDKQNVDQQLNYLREYCKARGWKYRSYVDDAMSGQISDRPNWQRLLRACEDKKIDSILVLKYDRITRDLHYALKFLDWLRWNNIVLYSIWNGGEFFFRDPDQEFAFKLDCLLSERELKIIKQRSAIGIERAKKEGKYKGGKKGRSWKKT